MKALKIFSALVLLFTLSFTSKARASGDERLNLPGDNLNLYAVMDLFRESETLEGFERSLNAEESKINNLDLNGNNLIDYIRVIDYKDGDAHSIVLQVAINERENQDVAVFTVFKDKRGQTQVQLVGDEYLYGKNYIIEPNYADNGSYSETPNPGYAGNNGQTVVVTRTTYVEVQSWPVVRYIYAPTYLGWNSPWYWGYYPSYWSPWRPYYWDYYYGYHSHWNDYYYGYYRHCNYYGYPYYADNYYHRHRAYSTTVRAYRDSGRYNTTYSRPDLRSEGSADYTKRYGTSGRGENRAEIGNQGRAKQDVRQDAGRRSASPAVSNRSSKPAERSSAGTDNKSRSASPAVNNRSSKSTERSSEGVSRTSAGTDNKSRTASPAVSNRSSKSTERSSASQGVSRTSAGNDNKSRSASPAVSNRSSKSTERSSASQGVSRSSAGNDNRSQSASPAVSSRSSKSNDRSSTGQSASKPSGRSDASGSSVKSSGSSSGRSEARSSAQPGQSNQGEKKSNGRK